jgi:putative lipoprotein
MRPLVLAAAVLMTTSSTALAGPPLPAPDPDPWFGRDKALHFTACAAISGAGYGVTALGTPDVRIRVAFSAGLGIVAGAGKELLDLAGFGDPSWKDFAWDVIGTIVGVGISLSVDAAARGLHPGYGYPR